MPCGVLLRAGFKALLRPSEVGNLRAGSVLLPRGALGLQSSCVPLVDAPKNKRVLGRMHFAMLSDLEAVRWLSWLADGVPSCLLLLPGGLSRLRACFPELGHWTGVEELHLVPASLRSGGATEFMKKVGNLPLLCHKCRPESGALPPGDDCLLGHKLGLRCRGGEGRCSELALSAVHGAPPPPPVGLHGRFGTGACVDFCDQGPVIW